MLGIHGKRRRQADPASDEDGDDRQTEAQTEPAQQQIEVPPYGAEIQMVAHGRQPLPSCSRAPVLLILDREANGRLGQIDTEPLLEGSGVGAEIDAGHGLVQRGVDEVEPVLIATLDRAGIALRVPAVAGIQVFAGRGHDQPFRRGLVGCRRVRPAAVDRLIDQIDALVLIDLGLRQGLVDHILGIDVLQHGDGGTAAGRLQLVISLHLAVRGNQ